MLGLPGPSLGKVQGAEGRGHNFSTDKPCVWKVRPEVPAQAWS